MGLRVLFATAEYETVVKIGGLGEASRGLVRSLGEQGVDVEVVVPDYGDLPVEDISAETALVVPPWVGWATARRVCTHFGEELTLVRLPSMERPHPYNEPGTGFAWHDNDHRFFAFCAAVASLAERERPDVVHLNDWHTALVPALTDSPLPTVLTVHNAAYQGTADPGWTNVMRGHHAAYAADWMINPLAGAISVCQRVVAVSQGYADDLRRGSVANLTSRCRARGTSLIGIRNGIDTAYWNPAANPHIPTVYDHLDLSGKEICRKELLRRTTLADGDQPIIAMVSRLVEQKGVDLALDLAPYLASTGASLVIIGDGEAGLVARAARAAGAHPERVHFFGKYSDETAALMMAGADLLLAPSRFEPCGLTQMQAMRFGAIPVVTAVGGLGETVIDADRHPDRGNGFVASSADALHLLDAMHRSVRAISDKRRRRAIQQRGMRADWSWGPQAQRYAAMYNDVVAEADLAV
jgi:starch synthase